MLATNDDAARLRKKPSQARSRRTVATIVEAADRVLRSEGFEAASTNRIARVAGLSVGSLYQYFDDKASVIGAAVDGALRAEGEELARRMEQAARLPLPEMVGNLVAGLVESRIERSHLLEVLAEHPEISGQPPLQRILKLQSCVAEPLERLAAAQVGSLRRGDLDAMLFVASRTANAVSFACAVEEPSHLTEKDVAHALSAGLARYLSKEGDDAGDEWHAAAKSLVDRYVEDVERRGEEGFAGEVGEAGARRRQRRAHAARSSLLRLRDDLDLRALEATVFVVSRLVPQPIGEAIVCPPDGLDRAELRQECVRVVAACLRAPA